MPLLPVNPTRRRTLGFLLAGALLAVGTTGYLALTRPGLQGYLLHPLIFASQAAPYLLAAALWLPWRSAPGATAGQVLAGLLLLSAALLYLPMLTGLFPVGGDMVGLGFIMFGGVTALGIVVATLVAHGILYLRRRGRAR